MKAVTPPRKAPARLGIMTDRQAESMLLRLLRIPGGSGREDDVAAFVIDQLKKNGAGAAQIAFDKAHTKSRHGGNLGNLIFKSPGTLRGPRRLFSAHMDTVPICVGSQPKRVPGAFCSADPARGIGADDRSGVCVLLATAVDLLRRKKPHYPLTLVWTVQEEVGINGVRHLGLGLLGKPKLAFNFDGGRADQLTLGATGGYRMKIYVSGKASHAGAHPEQGVSAIAIASTAVADLNQHGWHGLIKKGRRTGTSNFGVFRGGEATNVVADTVVLEAEARSHEPAFRERIVEEIKKAFRRAVGRIRNERGERGGVEFEGQLDYESFRLDRDSPCVREAADAVRAEGAEPDYAVANGGLDANWITARVAPTVSLGCGQQNIHTVDERLDLEHFHLARRVAMRLATGAEAS